jgi:hypothetical protein
MEKEIFRKAQKGAHSREKINPDRAGINLRKLKHS